MAGQKWRVLQDETVPEGTSNAAVWNMERDERLLKEVLTNGAAPILRLYQWQYPAVTLGRFQDAERTTLLSSCEEQNIPVARRITGGRGILHGDDLTLGVAASLPDIGLRSECRVIEIYNRFAACFVHAFQAIGIPAAMGACGRDRAGEARGDCFASISRADVIEISSRRKLLGAALLRRQGGILLQASIPLYAEPQRYQSLAALLFRGGASALPHAASHSIEPAALKRAIVQGFCAVFEFPVDDLNPTGSN